MTDFVFRFTNLRMLAIGLFGEYEEAVY